MRRTLCMGLVVLAVCLTACGKKETSDTKETQLPVVEEVENEMKKQISLEEKTIDEEETIEPIGDSSIEAQFQLFIDKSDIWYDEELVSYAGMRFTFFDLDQNGRIEMLLAESANSGHYTSSYIYEVNESYNDIIEIKYRMNGEEVFLTEPDIIEDCTRVYEKDGEIFYLYDDYVRSGYPYHACARQVICKRGNYIDIENLAILEANYDQLSEEEYGYVIQITDGDGKTIDLDTYRKADELYFENETPRLATFSWEKIGPKEWESVCVNIDTITTDIMEELYHGFAFTDGEIPENHYYDPEQLEDPYVIQYGQ